MSRLMKVFFAGLAGATMLATAANAGGFSRGTADTDILFEEGNFNMRAGVTYVAPQRGYDTIGGVASTDGVHTNSYAIPSAAIKFNAAENARCAGTVTEAFGGSASYGVQSVTAGITAQALAGNPRPSATEDVSFSITEMGVTCGYGLDIGKGRAWLLGGVFNQSIEYSESKRIGHPTLGPLGTLNLKDDSGLGYRLGLAYEIPEIALRVQGMYRSGVSHSLKGEFDLNGGVINPAAIGRASFPQSFELKAQSGVAPGWLVYGSLKWTEWSVFDVLEFTSVDPSTIQEKEFFYKDGWTVSAGVAHAFSDNLAATVGLTWDQGVGTTEDVSSDTWTVSGGVAVTDNFGGQLRFGGAVSYLTGGSVGLSANPDGTGAGSDVATSVDGDWAYAISASYGIKF